MGIKLDNVPKCELDKLMVGYESKTVTIEKKKYEQATITFTAFDDKKAVITFDESTQMCLVDIPGTIQTEIPLACLFHGYQCTGMDNAPVHIMDTGELLRIAINILMGYAVIKNNPHLTKQQKEREQIKALATWNAYPFKYTGDVFTLAMNHQKYIQSITPTVTLIPRQKPVNTLSKQAKQFIKMLEERERKIDERNNNKHPN